MNVDGVVMTGRGVLCAPGVVCPDDLGAAVIDGRSGLGPATRVVDPSVIAEPVAEIPEAELDGIGSTDSLRIERMARYVTRAAVRESGLGPGAAVQVLVATTAGPRAPGDWELGGLPEEGRDAAGADPVMGRDRYDRLGHAAVAELPGSRLLGTFNTGCSSGGSALAAAWHLLSSGDADHVLCVGAEEFIAGLELGFLMIGAVAPGVACDPYGVSGGTSLGEGAAAVLLERRSVAGQRGATVLADIDAVALTADGFHISHPDPDGGAAETAIRSALATAGVAADGVDLVSGHGTGTAANDAAEQLVHERVFAAGSTSPTLFSTKGVHGHCVGAGALVELIALVELLRRGARPGAFYAPGSGPRSREGRRRPDGAPGAIGLNSSFAMGGLNAVTCVSVDAGTRRGRALRVAPVALAPGAVVISAAPPGELGGPAEEWGADPVAFDPRAEVDRVRSVDPRKWRRLDWLSRHVAGVAARTLTAAGLEADPSAFGIVYASTYGPVMTTVDLSDAMRSGRRINPASIAAVSMSAAASNATELLGVHGHTTVVVDRAGAARLGLEHAVRVVASGEAPAVVVITGEEFDGRPPARKRTHPSGLDELRTGLDHPMARPNATGVLVARADHLEAGGLATLETARLPDLLADITDRRREALEPVFLSGWLLAGLNAALAVHPTARAA